MNPVNQSKSGLNQMAIYLCEAYIQTGLTKEDARLKVSQDLNDLSETYSNNKPVKMDKSRMFDLLNTALKQAKGLGIEGMAVKNTLVTIKGMLEADK